MKNPKQLPSSEDEFWDGEKITCSPNKINICPTHTRETWMNHKGYKDNHDGSVSCMFCMWGTKLPGYMRMVNGVIYDLRSINKDSK